MLPVKSWHFRSLTLDKTPKLKRKPSETSTKQSSLSITRRVCRNSKSNYQTTLQERYTKWLSGQLGKDIIPTRPLALLPVSFTTKSTLKTVAHQNPNLKAINWATALFTWAIKIKKSVWLVLLTPSMKIERMWTRLAVHLPSTSNFSWQVWR